MYKLILLTVIGLSAANRAYADQGVSTMDKSCRYLQNLVASSGSIVLSTGYDSYLRYVANENFCPGGDGQGAYVAYVPAKDTNTCRVGYVCNFYNN